jgi:AraC-like DNA-binding protein
MKVLPFKVPKTENESFRVQIENDSHFYGELHSHPEIQITYIIESYGTLVAGDFIGQFEPGNLIIVGSNQPHVFRNNPEYFMGENGLKANCTSLFIRKNMFGKEFMDMPEIGLLKEFFTLTDRGLLIDKGESIKMLPLINSFQTSEGFSKLVVLFNFLDKIIKCSAFKILSSIALKKELNEKEGIRMNAIYQFTLTEYHNPISLKKIADIANLTPQSFCRYFKKHTRKSYVNFLSEVRIGHACQKLQYFDNSITTVCFTTGFNNLSNFNRQFKSVVGITPKEYRNKFSSVK